MISILGKFFGVLLVCFIASSVMCLMLAFVAWDWGFALMPARMLVCLSFLVASIAGWDRYDKLN